MKKRITKKQALDFAIGAAEKILGTPNYPNNKGAHVRYLAFFALIAETGMIRAELARLTSMDHTTISYGVNSVAANPALRLQRIAIRKELKEFLGKTRFGASPQKSKTRRQICQILIHRPHLWPKKQIRQLASQPRKLPKTTRASSPARVVCSYLQETTPIP